jgi:ATP synthase, F0 subunit c
MDFTSLGAAIVFALVGFGAAIGMGLSISKAVESIGRQPEADGKIRSSLMIGLAFIETLALYALIIAIMILVL